MKKYKNVKEISGITLIALVTTIVVLIILASVGITLSLSNNGLFSRTKQAKEEHQTAINEEKLGITKLANDIETQVNSSRETITISQEEYTRLTNNFNYIIGEKEIGTWINGKKLYRRVIEGGSITGLNNLIELDSYNIEEVIYLYARMNTANGDNSQNKIWGTGPAPHSSSSNGYHGLYYDASKHAIGSWSSSDTVKYDYIVIEYTKK